MLTKLKHFGVRNNIEKGRGSSLAQTVSRFVAGIVALEELEASWNLADFEWKRLTDDGESLNFRATFALW